MNSKQIIKLLIIPLMVLILCGCSHDVTYGEIINKEHNEPYRQLLMLPVHISNGKTSTTILVPYWIFHEENWKIEIKGKNKDGKIDTETYYITEDLYDNISIGDMYEYREKFDTTEEPTRKVKESAAEQEELEKYRELK